MKTKILVWSDYAVPTGFANVMSNILRRLPEDEFEIDVLGVNFNGNPDYDRDRFPGRIWPARTIGVGPYNDLHGKQKLLDMLKEGFYDTLFILQDTFVAQELMSYILNIRKKYNKQFKIVYYFPIDSPPWSNWITNSVSKVDVPVVYTQYGYENCLVADPTLKSRLKVIPHGIDLEDFYKITEDDNYLSYRSFYYPASMGKFLLGNINRNQPRKNIVRSLQLLRELRTRGREDVALYLHMNLQDIGGDFSVAAAHLDLKKDIDYFIPKDLSSKGYPIFKLNMIYNMLDAVITTSYGEGWGLSLTEAMAAQKLVIGPDHTSIGEILGDGRGILVNAGQNSNYWTTIDADNMTLRPVTNVIDMADKIEAVIDGNHIEDVEDTIENAYKWVQTLDWNILVEKYWKELLVAEQN